MRQRGLAFWFPFIFPWVFLKFFSSSFFPFTFPLFLFPSPHVPFVSPCFSHLHSYPCPRNLPSLPRRCPALSPGAAGAVGLVTAGPAPPPRPRAPGRRPGPALSANSTPLSSWQQVTRPGAGQSGGCSPSRPAGGGRDARAGKARQRGRSAQPARRGRMARAVGLCLAACGLAWLLACCAAHRQPSGKPGGHLARRQALRGCGAARRRACGRPFSAPVGAGEGKAARCQALRPEGSRHLRAVSGVAKSSCLETRWET